MLQTDSYAFSKPGKDDLISFNKMWQPAKLVKANKNSTSPIKMQMFLQLESCIASNPFAWHAMWKKNVICSALELVHYTDA